MAKSFAKMTCDEKAEFVTNSLATLATEGNVIEVTLSGADTTRFSNATRTMFMDFVKVAAIGCPKVQEIIRAIEEPSSRRYGFGYPTF
ncbi:MAG: hypothetical protein JKX81_09620 [Arenicella sp.]|nr:hypothetical protein [Arenicella sp.]